MDTTGISVVSVMVLVTSTKDSWPGGGVLPSLGVAATVTVSVRVIKDSVLETVDKLPEN